MSEPKRWAVQWHSQTRDEGVTEYFIWENLHPLLFVTRREAREYIQSRYGYINTRPDLRAEPHGWRLPRAVKVSVVLKASK